MRWVGLIATVLALLLACRSSPPPPQPVWENVDGSPVIPNELTRDKAICDAADTGWSACNGWGCIEARAKDKERHRRGFAACMAKRGWIHVPVESE